MYGISSQTKEQISKVVENLFDSAALRLVGSIPKLQRKKPMLIGFEETVNLANLFVQAMNNKYLNPIENDVLKGILEGAYSYIDVLKSKTSNNIIQRIDGLAREARIESDKIPQEELQKILSEELGKAKSGLEAIAASESTKARNLGMAMDISRAAASSGDTDPVVGFAVINDIHTCKYCKDLHFMDDGVTPKLYRISELTAGYFKRGDKFPSILGLHPHCRCTLFMVPSDWGFDKSGHLTFIGIGHSELVKQRS